MSQNLGTMEDLPPEYRRAVELANTTPLWPLMRKALPHDTPVPQSKACLWAFDTIRPLLLRAGELTPVEKAERRVLILSDPGRGPGAMRVAGPIFCGMQLLLPGEKAPAHRHTPSAARIVIEGEGAYTIVNGEKCAMEQGDLILTPGGAWHDHGHDGKGPVIWLDALDLPLFIDLEAAYSVERELQAPKNRPDASEVEYATPGMVPARRNGHARPTYPMMRYPWANAAKGLRALAEHTPRGEPVELDYVNPETGDACLPTMGFTAMMLRPGESVKPPLRSTSAVHHVVAGSGKSTIGGESFNWKRGDTFSAPVFALIDHQATGKEPAFLIRVHDTPLQEKLNYYEERPRPQ
jgi:gentisate 1,2-dioxygenase